MAANTYVALQTTTVSGTSTTSVTLSGISGSYTDLRLVISSQNQNSTNQPYIQFNTDTSTGSTNYSTTSLRGDGSSAASSRHTNQNGWYPVPGPGVGTTGNFQPWLVDIMNYSNATTFKTGISRFNNASSIVSANAHLWRNTAPITSITITAESGAGYIVPGSTFTLYGIAAAGGTKATGGTLVYSDASYYYHVFQGSGTFTPFQALTVDYLVVAGGGAGAGAIGTRAEGGGGGAGGYRTSIGGSQLSVTATNYVVTVGGGGAGVSGTYGSNGTDSTFGSVTATGGGRGAGGANQVAPGVGGSGGGGSNQGGAAATGGAGNTPSTSPAQGYAGGNGNAYGTSSGGGGGGGAGGAGANAVSNVGGAGGAGVANSITGTSVTYAAGGIGGDTRGDGNGYSPAANTGNGGGAASTLANATWTGGSGASGIVVIRYAK